MKDSWWIAIIIIAGFLFYCAIKSGYDAGWSDGYSAATGEYEYRYVEDYDY